MKKRYYLLPVVHLIIPLFWFILSLIEEDDPFFPANVIALFALTGAGIAMFLQYLYLLIQFLRKKAVSSLFWWIFGISFFVPFLVFSFSFLSSDRNAILYSFGLFYVANVFLQINIITTFACAIWLFSVKQHIYK